MLICEQCFPVLICCTGLTRAKDVIVIDRVPTLYMVAADTLIGTHTNQVQNSLTLAHLVLTCTTAHAWSPDPPVSSAQNTQAVGLVQVDSALFWWSSPAFALCPLSPVLQHSDQCDFAGSCTILWCQHKMHTGNCGLALLAWCVCFARWCTFVALTEHWEEANLTSWEIMQGGVLFLSLNFPL